MQMKKDNLSKNLLKKYAGSKKCDRTTKWDTQ